MIILVFICGKLQYFSCYPSTSFCFGKIIHFSDLSDSPQLSPSHPSLQSCSLLSSELGQRECCQPSAWSHPRDIGCGYC